MHLPFLPVVHQKVPPRTPMFSYYQDSPEALQAYNHDRLESAISKGEYDPLPEIRTRIMRQSRADRRNTVTTGFTVAFLGSIGLGVTFSLTPTLIGVFAGGCILYSLKRGFGGHIETMRALNDDEIQDFLTDEELDDLDGYVQSFVPATPEAKAAYARVKEICDELLEPEEEVAETVDVSPDQSIKTPNNPPLNETPEITTTGLRTPNDAEVEEPQYVDSPWLKDAKLTPAKPEEGKVAKLTLREDGFIDKIDKEVEASVKGQIGEELSEIRMVQGEQMGAVIDEIAQIKQENTELKALILELRQDLLTASSVDDLTPKQTDEEMYPNIVRSIKDYQESEEEMPDFLRWLLEQGKANKARISFIEAKDAHWAKKHKCRDKDTVNSFLQDAVSLGYLQKAGGDFYALNIN